MGLKIFGVALLCLLLQLNTINSKRVIWDEVISTERLESRINTFNEWYTKFNKNAPKVEARMTRDPTWTRIGLFAKETLQADDVFMTIEREKMIKADLIYDTKIGPLIKELETQFGYDDYVNMVFYLLHEMNNRDSIWKPYLDLLPRQPTSPVFKYWDKKRWIEDELTNTLMMKKLVDYKFLLEKKSRNYYGVLVANHTDVFDPEFFNEENLEWACLTLDSRLVYVDYEAFLVPMLDFANFKQSERNPEKTFRAKFNEAYTNTSLKAMETVFEGEELFINFGYSNDHYLQYHGIVLKENNHDCFSVSLKFSSRTDDNLRENRKNFFAKYFLYDDNESDRIDECISLKNPYPRRLLFYYFTLLMEDVDLEKTDPRRSGLENDRIVVEQVKNALQTTLDLYPTTLSSDEERLAREPENYKKNIIKYLVEQKKYLMSIINVYQNQLNKLNKEDIL